MCIRDRSNRWRKTKERIAALHTRVGNARRDGLHKLSTRLVASHDVVVVEDLNASPLETHVRSAWPATGTATGRLRS